MPTQASGQITESGSESEKSKRKTVLKLCIQYGYQLCLTFELKIFQTKKAGIGKGVCWIVGVINYVIFLTIITKFDFTCWKTISPLFYKAKQTEWLLFDLSDRDIEQIIITCCKVIKPL